MTFSKKQILSVLLSSALLISTVPMTVCADDTASTAHIHETVLFPDDADVIHQLPPHMVTVSNPLYDDSGTVSQEFVIPPSLDADTSENQGIQYYIHTADAADVIRTEFSSWAASFHVPFCISTTETFETQESLQTFLISYALEVFSLAQEHTGNPREGDYLAWNTYKYSYGYTQPSEISYEDHTEYYLYLVYTPYYRTTAAQEAEFDAAANTLLDTLFGKERITFNTYRTIKTIYDWICTNVTYDDEHLGMGTDPNDENAYRLHHTAYAALLNGTSVCQGYALLMYYLLLEMGIDCRMVAGQGNGGAHGWNIAEIDGLYYNLDSTWDAVCYPNYQYFLLNEKTFTENYTDHFRYTDYETSDFHAAHPMSADNYVYTQSGDTNSDGIVTEDDAFYLLRSTLLPDRYPLYTEDADFDWDNRITAADAAYLYNNISEY